MRLPAPEEHRFHLDLWQHPSNIARKHETPLWSDAHFAVLERYVESLGALGQKCVTVIASEIPWSGQCSYLAMDYPSNLFEYSMIRVERDEEGKLHCDFSVLSRYIDLCAKYGICEEYEVFGLINIWVHPEVGLGQVSPDFPDAIRIRCYDRADGVYRFLRKAEEIEAYIRAVEAYFQERGLIDRVRVVADEPAETQMYFKRLENLSRIAPSFRCKTAINHAEFITEMGERVRDYVPSSTCVAEKLEKLQELRQELGGRFCWYVCCSQPYPNTFLDSPLLEARLIGPLTAYWGLDGFLRWNYTVWPEHPRERISFFAPNWRAGETNFVYPSWSGGPLLTLRLKALRRGIEDYELIVRAKEQCGAQAVDRLWGKLLRNRDIHSLYGEDKSGADSYSLDYKDYDTFKAEILRLLEKCAKER